MNRSPSQSLRYGIAGIAVFAICQTDLTATPTWAQTPVAPPPAAEAPAAPTLQPSLSGPLSANANPINFDAAGLGHVYVSGVLSGLGLFQSDPFVGDRSNNIDLSNGMGIVQTTDGLVQFYVQAGGYSLPALGGNYHLAQRTGVVVDNTFGLIPVGYIKLAPTDTFSIQAGSLPTLIGAEYTFTFQNMNIERGLLWAQEPAISKGVQANLTTGPVAWSVSFNDGLYSDTYNWLTGSATWTIDPANTLAVAGGGNLDHTSANTFVAPFFQNNESILNVIYTYNAAPWTITPYFQYTNVPSNPGLGVTKGAETWGGALLASYKFNDNWSLAGRAEYISSSGSATDGSPNLLGFGPGSSAFSFTLTPTYQQGIFFARAEGSIVDVSSHAPGSAFGTNGNTTTQGRFVIEAGILF